MYNVSRGKTEQPSSGTHFLDRRRQGMSARERLSSKAEELTFWIAEDRQCQQGETDQQGRNSLSEKQRLYNVSSSKTEQSSSDNHFLDRR